MHKKFQSLIAMLTAVLLLVGMIYIPTPAEAANAFYGDYTDVAKIYDYGSCPSMQGLAVGSGQLYTVKTGSNDTKAFISMTNKDTGSTTKLYNADAGSYYFDYLGHANDMDVWGIDGYSNLFVATTNKGAQSVVRLKRSGNNLYKVAQYRLVCNGSEICATALSIMGVSNGQIKLLTKWGMDLYTGTVSTSATNTTVEMTKLCTITKNRVLIKGSYLDLSSFVNQGMGYYQDTLFVPITGDDTCLNRSVIMVFDLSNVATGSTIYPTEALVFRVTSGAYSALFEIESCDISSGDGKLYFNTNRRKTNSDTNHDGVSRMDDYSFERIPVDAPTSAPTYTLHYNANGGTGTMADTVITYGIAQKLRANAFTREGYVFQGWTAYRTAQKQWYYTGSGGAGWYAEGSQPSGYTKYIYKDQAGVAKTTSVDGDVVQLYAQWAVDPNWKPQPTLPTGTVPAYLERVTSPSQLQEGVPYVISDYRDSWKHYILTSQAAQKVSGAKTHTGLLLDGTPSTDTTHLWYIRDGKLVYGSANSNQYLLISCDSSSQGQVTIGSYNASTAASVIHSSGDDFIIKGSTYLNRHGGTASDVVATGYASVGGSFWHLDRVVPQQSVTFQLEGLSLSAGNSAALAPIVEAEGVATKDYEIVYSSSDSAVAAVSAKGNVTGLKAGTVTITAKLTKVFGQTLVSPVTVAVTVTVKANAGTVAVVQDAVVQQVGTLQTGVAYIITEKNSGAALTGNMLYKTDAGYKGLNGLQGLQTIPAVDLADAPVWYYDGTGLRWGSPSGAYLVLNSSNQVALGSGTKFDTLQIYSGSYFNIYSASYAASHSSCYLNQMGGANYNVAGLYSSAYYSQWKFSCFLPARTVALNIASRSLTLNYGDQFDLAPVVTVDGKAVSGAKVSWTTSDASVATVSNGIITAEGGGNATITATVSSVDGRAVSLTMDVALKVEAGSYTASVELPAKLVKTGTLQAGVPYVITEKNTGAVLTGSMVYKTDADYKGLNGTQGLKLVNTLDMGNAPVWYYDGTGLRYGSPSGQYLVYNTSGQVALGSGSKFDTVKLHDVSRNTFVVYPSAKSSGSTNYYLNQLGGGNYNAAGLYAYASTSQWYFSQLVEAKEVEVTVTPGLTKLGVGKAAALSAAVTVNGVAVSDAQVSWTTSNSSIATVSGGTVTAKAAGNVVITVTVTGAQGDTFAQPVTIEIPVTVG